MSTRGDGSTRIRSAQNTRPFQQRRRRLGLAFACVLAVACCVWHFDTDNDLSAATQPGHTTDGTIRLQTPTFKGPTNVVAANGSDQPLPGMQIIPQSVTRSADSPIIQSRQQLEEAIPTPTYNRPSVSQSHDRLISHAIVTPADETNDKAEGAPTATATTTATAPPVWSVPPIKVKTTPLETEKKYAAEPGADWSDLPSIRATVPEKIDQLYREQAGTGWSLRPDEAFTIPRDTQQVPTQTHRPAEGRPGKHDADHHGDIHANSPPAVSSPRLTPSATDHRSPPATSNHLFPQQRPSLPKFEEPPELPEFTPLPESYRLPELPDAVNHTQIADPAATGSVETNSDNSLFIPRGDAKPADTGPPVGHSEVPILQPGMRDTVPGFVPVPVIPTPRNELPSAHDSGQNHDSAQSLESPAGHDLFQGQSIYQPQAPETLLPATTDRPPVSGYAYFGPPPGTSGFRATVERDAAWWMSPYNSRAMAARGVGPAMPTTSLSPIPGGYVPWWDNVVRQSAGLAHNTIAVDVSRLLQDAMLYSPQVTAIKTEPEVQYRVVTQEAAEFDWTVFLDSTYDDLNDPVGNELTTGNGDDRLLTRNVRGRAGVRQKNIYGGEVSLFQQLGHENQNSRFFVPANQASTRLELAYRQPLLDGGGRCYNESEVVLARIKANSSEDEVVDALQDHLIEVTKAYWTLYRARSEYFQRQKLLKSAYDVLTRLQGRSQVDTIPRQVLRATAAVARAQTRIQRTIARVKDAEAQLRLLVNSPAMLNGGPTELTPIEAPRMVTESADLQSVLQTALINRPDISEAIRKMRASSVRLGVSKQELLPRLDFLVETYIADLAGNSDLREALRGQYFDNRPGYTVGLEFEFPLENRAARAKLEQRQWELKRSINVFRATVEKSLTDVEIANREVATAYSEILSRYQSMVAAENETQYLQDRFDVLPAAEDSAILLLEDLLDSFERLADEESSFVQAQVDHAVALVALKKELGILLQSRHARPSVEPVHQQWIDDRVNSVIHGIPVEQTGRRDAESDASTAAATSPVAVRAAGHAHVVRRPVPATPTQWTRPSKSAGYSMP